METSRRQLVLPPLSSPASTGHGHGKCREGVVPSGEQKPAKWGTVSRSGLTETGVKINYSKLRELCENVPDQDSTDSVREKRHEIFMSNYRLLLHQVSPDRSTTTSKHGHVSSAKRHSCTCNTPVEQSHDVGSYVEAIHRCHNAQQSSYVQSERGPESRLTAIHSLLEKLPPQRDAKAVKEIAHYLSHFPSLLPDKATPTVWVGVAARCVLETIPKGFSLPDKGGTYLILQGYVEKSTKDDLTHQASSTLLCKGDHFGTMEENFPTKHRYPMYVTRSACALMRITVFDYHRVLQNCEAFDVKERLTLISSCPALHDISPAVLSVLATDIHWETIPTNTTLVAEGKTIERVGFIQWGHCKASMEVPRTRVKTQLVIGELGPGWCVGEGLLRGTEEQPYKVTTTTRVRMGWVSSASIRRNEVKKLIPSSRELSIPVPSKDELRGKYAHQLMQLHWKKIKTDIVNEARLGRGDRQATQTGPSQLRNQSRHY